jgi:pimeloyl-ACP methyl ester carboxylesterase
MDAEPATSSTPPILFLHGVFGTPSLLMPWTRFLEAAGHVVHTPAMPGREPTDDAVLSRTGVEECFAVALDAYDRLGEPAIVIGHSMGGLLAQKIAAAREPRAVVLLASVPPGISWPRLRPLPHLLRVMPKVLAGKPFLPSASTMREVPLNTLPADEREALIPQLVRDSGRVFLQISMGASVTRVKASDVTCPVLCVSAGSDQNVAPWISRRIARRYRAEHRDHPGKPHWIIAASALGEVGPPVVEWLRRTVPVKPRIGGPAVV